GRTARPRAELLTEYASGPHCDRLSSWQNGDAEEERIDRDGHRSPRAIEQPMRREVHAALIHHALREVGGVGRIVRRKNAEELTSPGKQAVVVADVREELEGRRRGRHGGEDDILVGREAVLGLLQAGDPAAGAPGPGHLL